MISGCPYAGEQALPSPLPSESNFSYLLSTDGKYTTWRVKSTKLFDLSIGGSTDELSSLTKSSNTGLDSTAVRSDTGQSKIGSQLLLASLV